MNANQADANNALSLRAMCRVLELSASGHYDWLRRSTSARAMANCVITEKIRQVHRDSGETYGMPRELANVVLWAEEARKLLQKIGRAPVPA